MRFWRDTLAFGLPYAHFARGRAVLRIRGGAVPYDPGNPDVFRRVLRRLADAGLLSSERAAEIVRSNRHKKNDVADLPSKPLDRHAINRFKKDYGVRDISGLRILWDVLEAHDNYRWAFSDVPEFTAPTTAEGALAQGLEAFFSKSSLSGSHPDIGTLRRRLVGRYLLYRPAWRLGAPKDSIMTSCLEVKATKTSFNIFEIQNFLATNRLAQYQQTDAGFVFKYGLYAYFMTAGTSGNTSLKLWAVEEISLSEDELPISMFRGVVYATGHYKFFPSAKFLCRRIPKDRLFQSEHIMPDKLPDDEARDYFASSHAG